MPRLDRVIDTGRREILYGFVDDTFEPPRYACVSVVGRLPNYYATAMGPVSKAVYDARMHGTWHEGTPQDDDPLMLKREDWHDAQVVAAVEDIVGDDTMGMGATEVTAVTDVSYAGRNMQVFAQQLAAVVLPPKDGVVQETPAS